MTSRERLMLALDHKEPDHIPLDLGAGNACKLHKEFYRRLCIGLGLPEYAENIRLGSTIYQYVDVDEKVAELLGTDVRSPVLKTSGVKPEPRLWEDETNRYMVNEFGTTFRMPKNGLYYDMIDQPLKGSFDEADDDAYVWPTMPVIDQSSVEQARQYQKDGYPTIFTYPYNDGFLQFGPKVYGYDHWLMLLSVEPERVDKIQQKLLEKKMEYWDTVLGAFGDAIDIVCESDDFGTQKGTFISHTMFREQILPRTRELYDYIHSKTKAKVFLHCCGSIAPFLGDLIDAGLDIINPVQITAYNMDPYYLKKEFGKDLTFWGGGIDTQHTLPNGSPKEIVDTVERCMDALRKDGGWVFSPVHNVQADVPVENFLLMLETFRKHCNY